MVGDDERARADSHRLDTRFRDRWIRATVLLRWLGTQRLPATIPPSTGCLPTRLISATRRFLRSSIFATELSSLFAAQTK